MRLQFVYQPVGEHSESTCTRAHTHDSTRLSAGELIQPRATNVVVRLKQTSQPIAARSSEPSRTVAEDEDDVGEWAQQIVVVGLASLLYGGWGGVCSVLLGMFDVVVVAAGGSCGARTNQTTVIFFVAGNILFGFLLLRSPLAAHFFSNFWFICNVCEWVCVCACVRAYECVVQWGVAAETHHDWMRHWTWVELNAPPGGKFTQRIRMAAVVFVNLWMNFISLACRTGECVNFTRPVCVYTRCVCARVCIWRVRVKQKLIVIGHGIGWRRSWQ